MYRKEIVYDRETRDYAMYLDGELVGFARTYHEAEVTLDQLVFELLSGQYFRRDADQARELLETGALATATELDGGSQPGGSGGGDGLMQMPEGDWLDTDGMRVPAPTAQRILVFCERCGAPGTTTDPDTDYVCSDCAAKQSRSVVYARPAEPEPEAIEADAGPLTNHQLAAIFADNILCLPIQPITIATSEGPQTTDALILGGWALNENSRGWTVTHRASGYAGNSYPTPIEALIQLGIIIGAGLPSIPSDTSTFASIPDIHNISARVKAGIAVLNSWALDLDYNERDDTSEPEPLASTASTGAPETAIAALTAAP